MKAKSERFRLWEYIAFAGVAVAVFFLCVCVGSVGIPLRDTLTAIWNGILGHPQPEGIAAPIILTVRVPRVLCVAFTGAAHRWAR